jgi:hypothetical protein
LTAACFFHKNLYFGKSALWGTKEPNPARHGPPIANPKTGKRGNKMHVKRMAALLFGLIASIGQQASSQNPGVNIVSYDIDAVIGPQNNFIEVTATCEMQKTDTTLETQLLFSLNSTLESVQSLSSAGASEIPFQSVGKDTLQLHFPMALCRPGPLVLKFKYKFPILPLGDSLLLLDRGSRWLPLIADQIAKLNLKGEVPDGYTVLSAGDLVETKTLDGNSQFHWKTDLPIFKVPLVVFKSSSRKIDSTGIKGKKFVLYSATTDTFPTASILAEAKNVFAFCTDVLGEYPYERLTLVEVPYFEGIDISSGLLMVGSPSLKGMASGHFDALRLTVAEQWMGAGVFAKFRQPGYWFLTISLPQYIRLMYVRRSQGEEAFQAALHEPLKQYEKFAGQENDVPILDIDFPNTREKGLVLYGKGPFVISRLHSQLGDKQWMVLLHNLYNDFVGKILTYDEFRDYIAKYDRDGSTLKLLDKLMTQKGIPEK